MLRTFVLVVLLVGVNCRYLLIEEQPELIVGKDGAEYYLRPIETIELQSPSRVRRQVQTKISVDGSGKPEISAKMPIARVESNILSVTGSQSPDSRSMGVALDTKNGHGLSVSQKSLPFGEQWSAGGNVNLLHTDKHAVDTNAFVTRTDPKFPNMPNFNTYGGGVGYTYNDKLGASLSAARTDFLQRTDVNALGHLNVFRDKDSSFDFTTGVGKSFSPRFSSSWEPVFGFSWSKSW